MTYGDGDVVVLECDGESKDGKTDWSTTVGWLVAFAGSPTHFPLTPSPRKCPDKRPCTHTHGDSTHFIRIFIVFLFHVDFLSSSSFRLVFVTYASHLPLSNTCLYSFSPA
uniref:Uncharacterized protein n=1 Tax=Trypanosoma congolense (strain IL3000) TaxID=1068625 RepID=G0USH4_TRYCI|nr:hypothetical protein, unlikely [Trypanosoma congolense IL3000]